MNAKPHDPTHDTFDPRIARLYREAAREEAPPHLDAHLLDAARGEAAAARAARDARSPAATGGAGMPRFSWPWRVSLAFAAVAVLSVSLLVLNPREQDFTPPASAPANTAENVITRERHAASDATAPAQRPPADKQKRALSGAMRDQVQARPDSSAERPAAPPAAPRAAQSADRRHETRQGYAELASPPQAAAPAKSEGGVSALARDYENAPPERWGEKIRELRQQGRVQEADALLSAFKARFPEHPVPEEWLK